jgi:hypothetical protein
VALGALIAAFITANARLRTCRVTDSVRRERWAAIRPHMWRTPHLEAVLFQGEHVMQSNLSISVFTEKVAVCSKVNSRCE